MTAQIESAPMVVSGETATGSKYIQFWGTTKYLSTSRNFSAASMTRGKDGRTSLHIDGDCPQGWLGGVWDAYCHLRDGVLIEPTHTIDHHFGTSILTPVGVLS